MREIIKECRAATPLTKRIFRISAAGWIPIKEQCDVEKRILQIVLENKYPDSIKWTSESNHKFEISFFPRFITVQCRYYDDSTNAAEKRNADKAMLLISYVDRELGSIVSEEGASQVDKMLEERASQVDKSNF